jgi:hypothetical protein
MSDAIRITQLSAAERKKLGSSHPEIREGRSAMLVSGSERALSAIEDIIQNIAREEEQSARLLEVMTEGLESGVPDASRVLQIQRQAEARDRFLREFATLNSQEVAEMSGSTARNTAALASRWKADGRVFALSLGRTDRYPAFQFGDEGKPLPVIARIIEVFGDESPWTLALWFAGNSGWLDGARPVDLLLKRPTEVVEAARRSTEPVDA